MKAGLVPLGCSKNMVDSEMILGNLKELGFTIGANPQELDLIIVNTCGFLQSAKEEAIKTIFEMYQYKYDNGSKLVVTGCFAQRYKESLIKEIPEVDLFISIDEYDNFSNLIANLMGINYIGEQKGLDFHNRVSANHSFYSYIRIGDGCDNKCAYCAIPLIRGPYKSRYIDDILVEVEESLNKGKKEIVLIAQDTTRFGKEHNESLAKLLLELVKNERIEMIRILYMYISDLTEEVIQIIKNNPKIAPYFDLPIQHASNKMLKLMNRRDTKEIIMDKIHHIKNEIPNAIIRSTLIVGFPHESEEDFQELYDLVSQSEFDRLGAFTYSREEDTTSYDMDEQIEEEVKQERLDKIMKLQKQISLKKGQARKGEITTAYIETYDPSMKMYRARDYSFAPDDVDGCIYISYKGKLIKGQKVQVKIVQSFFYDLVGEIQE